MHLAVCPIPSPVKVYVLEFICHGSVTAAAAAAAEPDHGVDAGEAHQRAAHGAEAQHAQGAVWVKS